MKQLKNFLIKREQSQACLSFAKREKSRLLAKTLLTLVALLALTTGARADWTGGTYTATATENLGAITVNGDATLTINSDVTVTVTGGINVASGTLTVTGPGTLVVNGAKGNNGASGWEGSNGGNGGVAISGNIIVQGGATVTATGGTGGTGGSGAFEAGTGGNGGVAFAGTLTYKSGTVTANGGSAGSGGYIDDEERYASSGSAGKAFANDVDFTQTTGYSVTNGTSTIESVLNQTKVVISGGTEPSASSGPEVAWDKAEKTGTFTMPGGNVTLEPEYYPQAALTAAPTAINDVPATTDGAIVNAGTVANIGSTETAQGTVMYYVSPTALDDAALQALAADQWTADVPTAADLAQGQAYVYYYVRGNDSDNDDEIFSDGDILAANALTVTIAAEPTYAVTFADDTAESDKWTAEPNTGVKKGQTVTVTYSGEKRVKSVKAVKKAAAPSVSDGAINGKFSVSATKQVYFSKGNLRYASGTWSFFDNQYDYYTSYSADAWDKFGWSTSATTYGMNTSESNSDYSGDFVDWGATMGTGWFTLSKDEWTYLFNTRSASTVGGTSNGRYAKAWVNNVYGVILFPDTYTHPEGVANPGGVNVKGANGWDGNSYTVADWTKMESAGCVFLPAAGYRKGTSVSKVGEAGEYWSTTSAGTFAYRVDFVSFILNPETDSFDWTYGLSVRLVREVTE